ncbi:MAG: hypothetical protein Q8876_01890 [Bacillota bacterium]|nr:hypothetical protein [Bacillota bacterium]
MRSVKVLLFVFISAILLVLCGMSAFAAPTSVSTDVQSTTAVQNSTNVQNATNISSAPNTRSTVSASTEPQLPQVSSGEVVIPTVIGAGIQGTDKSLGVPIGTFEWLILAVSIAFIAAVILSARSGRTTPSGKKRYQDNSKIRRRTGLLDDKYYR